MPGDEFPESRHSVANVSTGEIVHGMNDWFVDGAMQRAESAGPDSSESSLAQWTTWTPRFGSRCWRPGRGFLTRHLPRGEILIMNGDAGGVGRRKTPLCPRPARRRPMV